MKGGREGSSLRQRDGAMEERSRGQAGRQRGWGKGRGDREGEIPRENESVIYVIVSVIFNNFIPEHYIHVKR